MNKLLRILTEIVPIPLILPLNFLIRIRITMFQYHLHEQGTTLNKTVDRTHLAIIIIHKGMIVNTKHHHSILSNNIQSLQFKYLE